MTMVQKSFDILAISLNVPHNYFDGPNKIIFKSIENIHQRLLLMNAGLLLMNARNCRSYASCQLLDMARL